MLNDRLPGNIKQSKNLLDPATIIAPLMGLVDKEYPDFTHESASDERRSPDLVQYLTTPRFPVVTTSPSLPPPSEDTACGLSAIAEATDSVREGRCQVETNPPTFSAAARDPSAPPQSVAQFPPASEEKPESHRWVSLPQTKSGLGFENMEGFFAKCLRQSTISTNDPLLQSQIPYTRDHRFGNICCCWWWRAI